MTFHYTPPSPDVLESHRSRGTQLVILLVVIALGLTSRAYAAHLPVFVARYAGDTLWATAVFLLLGLIRPAARTIHLALWTAVIALAIELSQLAHPGWLEALRRQPGVGLLLGYDFLFSDLACYAVGIVIGATVDHRLTRRPHPTPV
jgi:hypothetical protein